MSVTRSGGAGKYEDIEVATFGGAVGIPASDLDGTTSFEGEENSIDGVPLLDYDDVVDRNERLQLLEASHSLSVYSNSTTTEDGTTTCAVEISAGPTRTPFGAQVHADSTDSLDGSFVGEAGHTDTIDIIGRPLCATATSAFSDTTNTLGGGGSAGHDSYVSSEFPSEYGAFHPRDELFINAEFRSTNVADAGIHAQIKGQHVYGVIQD